MRRPRDSAVLRRWLNGTCAVLVLGLVSCGANPAAEPVPTGVPSSPTASAEAQVSSSASQEALNAEAERVYRAFFAEEQKILLAGGAEVLPDSVRPYVTGRFAQVTEAIYQEFHNRGWRQQSGADAQISGLQPAENVSRAGYLAVLQTCTDTRVSAIVTADGQLLPGGINYTTLFFLRDGNGEMKIESSTDEVVEKCPIET